MDYTQGSNDIIVAVLDTGVDMKQPELAANIWTNPNPGKPGDPSGYVNDIHGWNFVENTTTPARNLLPAGPRPGSRMAR